MSNLTPQNQESLKEEFEKHFFLEPYYNRANPEKPHRDPNPETFDSEQVFDFFLSHHNKILSEILEECGKLIVNTPDEVAKLNRGIGEPLEGNAYCEAIGYEKAIKDVITFITNNRGSKPLVE